jgi:hypothetical protein
MTKWQFRLILLGIIILNIQIGFLASSVSYLGSESTPLFSQVRWITWKMDQSGNTRMKVEVER